ncbi:DUF853 domain-containing protein [Rhizobium sp.]|uniref:helicase HerA-like C-terminal domain-containing protein n=1 Tax=Rhizobium sp. TaxID=391 RepID=UPI000E9056F8|nr:ATP-binding protein [Rhizobium sp.]
MQKDGMLFLGASRHTDGTFNRPEYLTLKFANRHGLVTGATGTGKTVTLQVLAESFSNAGVPVFCADIKGDLSGIAMEGDERDFLVKRARDVRLEPYPLQDFPVIFWDLFGKKGHRVRTTMAEMGPLLLAQLMEASDAQEGVLNIAFKIADDHGLALLDMKDLQALLTYMAENAEALSRQFGLISKASVGSLQRGLLLLESQGAANFFGEPALDIRDIMRIAPDGRGTISVLAADRLMTTPRLYATFLLWLLSELFEELPEVGDLEKPKLVFFFDEAHLLFNNAPKVLIERVEQVVRLIRSKGVGVYFVTQNPLDVPETILAQLGNRVQHALRAYTPREQKAVKAAAQTFRPNPAFSCEEVITNLGTGEALISTLEDNGAPSMVQRSLIRPPSGRIGPLTDIERAEVMALSVVAGFYDHAIDRQSAFEILNERTERLTTHDSRDSRDDKSAASGWSLPDVDGEGQPKQPAPRGTSSRQRESVMEAALKSAARSLASQVANQIGRALVRGILGSLKR